MCKYTNKLQLTSPTTITLSFCSFPIHVHTVSDRTGVVIKGGRGGELKTIIGNASSLWFHLNNLIYRETLHLNLHFYYKVFNTLNFLSNNTFRMRNAIMISY